MDRSDISADNRSALCQKKQPENRSEIHQLILTEASYVQKDHTLSGAESDDDHGRVCSVGKS
jgi:hypothetical protein